MGNDTTTCKIAECERTIYVKLRGWCKMHYDRWLTHGDPLKTLMPTRVQGTLEERFWAKVDAEGICWEWTANLTDDGYGKIKVDGKMRSSHRVAWEMLVGPIPETMQLDHLCRNRACCNPDHLEVVTSRENCLRGRVAMRGLNLKTHCKNEHEYTPENTYVYKYKGKVKRGCRTCRRAYERERYLRNRT